ncbi:tagaturonate reductase [Aureibaculum sp. 2210JD6-5]|uniref:tagaturonate reductase n=1 Tax=Aureibaculum sp. 2210JD6-5 TaxID=3103957 RepID=UPI002AAEACFE|nr:tagaturonate reductase [Aureibaculum sp. 2210JD6-5]MDY7397037.1 tagaturonate reductase [Aureibaculum sp. 2210JD6-5]
MNSLNRKTVSVNTHTEKIIQFGGGNFLRCFVNWMVQILNDETDFNGGVVIVKPTEYGNYKHLKQQDGLFTVVLEGIKSDKLIEEKKLINSIQDVINPYLEWQKYLKTANNENLRFIVSNTTEAGISFNPEDSYSDEPPQEFPAKLTILMHKRFQYFSGDSSKGFIVLPCELIENNGHQLRECVLKYANLWQLGVGFESWIINANIFCNTLVDRIVSGYPKNRIDKLEKELNYHDKLMVAGEYYHSWIIEAPEIVQKELPFSKTDLNVKFVDNLEDYRNLKVRVLNGAHTTLVPVGYLYGIDSVRESLEDQEVSKFLNDAIFNEICPILDLPKSEIDQFANDVLDRFRNPYLEHQLISISLNSISKYKTRVLPSVFEYIKRKQELPNHLLFSLAALIVFYRGKRNGDSIALKDDKKVLDFFSNSWKSYDNGTIKIDKLVKLVLTNTSFWGKDLTQHEGFEQLIFNYLSDIINEGMKTTLNNFESQH